MFKSSSHRGDWGICYRDRAARRNRERRTGKPRREVFSPAELEELKRVDAIIEAEENFKNRPKCRRRQALEIAPL